MRISLRPYSYNSKKGLCGIVFSKDRAMQLEALFSSMMKFTRGLFDELHVVYKATEPDYKYTYEILKEDYPEINFIEETDFKQNITDCLKTKCRYTLFLTDDDIIFNKINKGFISFFTKDTICFSYRLGLNINYCYSNDKPNKLKVYSVSDNYISWDWDQEELDFAYPLSVTSHVFRTKQIRDLLSDLYYQTPNIMEGKLQTKLDDIPTQIVSYKHSAIVGVPANRVNVDTNNRHGLSYPYSTKELNDLFLQNKKIDIDKMDFSNINAAQQEIKYEFK